MGIILHKLKKNSLRRPNFPWLMFRFREGRGGGWSVHGLMKLKLSSSLSLISFPQFTYDLFHISLTVSGDPITRLLTV